MIFTRDFFKFWHLDCLDSRMIIFLRICFMHNSGMISDKKRNGMFKSLMDGNYDKVKANYHCTINDRWYNDEKMTDILEDVCQYKELKEFDFETLLKYINLYANARKNYCLKFAFTNIVHPLLRLYQLEHFSNPLDYIKIDVDYLDLTSYDNFKDCESRSEYEGDFFDYDPYDMRDDHYLDYKRKQYEEKVVNPNFNKIAEVVKELFMYHWDIRSTSLHDFDIRKEIHFNF